MCVYINQIMPTKFKNTNKDSGGNRTFKCNLKCSQCTGTKRGGGRCKNRVCQGVVLCHQHRKSVKLKVKQSGIARAGKGLFAWEPSNGGNIFKKGDTIGYYRGELISNKRMDKRYGKTGNAPYTVATSRSSVAGNTNKNIDAGCKRGLMSLANGSRGMAGANARFIDNIRPDKTIAVKATKNIQHNKEIVLHYGKAYFDSMKKNTNKTR